jgi:hypothetical protein
LFWIFYFILVHEIHNIFFKHCELHGHCCMFSLKPYIPVTVFWISWSHRTLWNTMTEDKNTNQEKKFCGLGLLVFIVVSPIYKHLCHGLYSFHLFYSNIPTIPLTFHFGFSLWLETLDSPAIRLVEIYRYYRYNRNIGIVVIIVV